MNARWLSLVAIGLLAGLPFRLTAQTAPHPFQATDYYKLADAGELVVVRGLKGMGSSLGGQAERQTGQEADRDQRQPAGVHVVLRRLRDGENYRPPPLRQLVQLHPPVLRPARGGGVGGDESARPGPLRDHPLRGYSLPR